MLDLNLTTILFQIANFLILAILLYFLMFKNIIKRVELRKKTLEALELAAKQNFDESEKLKNELKVQIDNAQAQINEKILQTKSELEINQLQIIDITKKRAAKIISQAIQTAQLEQNKMMQEFNGEIVSSIMEIVNNIFNNYSPKVFHNGLIVQANERIWDLGKKEMDRVEIIRRGLKDREPILSVETAFPLTTEQQAGLVRTFSALADKNVQLETTLDKNLGAGIRIRLGDFIINSSLDALLKEIESTVVDDAEKLVKKYNK